MAVSAMLRSTEVTVTPGGSARCHVQIRNNAVVVDQFVFAVMGDVVDWTEVRPGRVNLLPNQEVTVELTFSPPKSFEVLAGDHPFALKVSSREDEAGSVVQEGMVTVTKFVDVVADVVPKTSEGRRRGKHTLALDNLGNYEHIVEVLASDPDNRVTFKIKPRGPQLTPGTTSFVKVRARPKKYFWKGADRTLPFTVKVLAPTMAPIEVDAALLQKPLLPRRLFWLLSMLLALLLVLLMLVTMLLRQRPISIAGPAPSVITSTERTTVASSTPATTVTTSFTSATTSAATTSRTRGAVSPGGGGGGGGGGGSGDGAVPAEFVVETIAYPNAADRPQLFSFVVPENRTYRLNSVLLRNTAGDVGDLEIRHNDRVLGRFSLAAIDARDGNQFSYRFPNPPEVPAGELVTMAVTCRNAENPCTPSGTFAASAVAP